MNGPAIQAGSISGGVNITVAGAPSEVEVTDDALANSLRKSSQVWRARFSSVDFVNLPRVAMLSEGGAVVAAAKRAGLDSTKHFRGQGMAPGEFVRVVRPLFEAWNTEAVTLCERTASEVRRGMLVSFEASMRCCNAPEVPLREPTGDLTKDPHLVLRVGGSRVIISFDPRWLTTSTATTTLHDAVREPLVFSGLGSVASVSEGGHIRVSALVFGQPETLAQAQFRHVMRSKLSDPPGLTEADFRNELSPHEEAQWYSARSRERSAVSRISIALLFDEDEVLPDQIDRAVLAQVSRVVPEYRRDLGVAVASLVINDQGVTPADISAQLLARQPELWKSFTVPGLTTLVSSHNLAVSTVSGLSLEQVEDLHEAMLEAGPSYLGSIEMDRRLPLHERLFPDRDQYHVVGAELRLRYNAQSRMLAEANGDDLEEPLNRWRMQELFRSVEWEEDLEQSAADERIASMIVQNWLNAQSQ